MDNIVKVPLKFCYLDSSGNDYNVLRDYNYNYKHYFLASAIVSISTFHIDVPVNSVTKTEFTTRQETSLYSVSFNVRDKQEQGSITMTETEIKGHHLGPTNPDNNSPSTTTSSTRGSATNKSILFSKVDSNRHKVTSTSIKAKAKTKVKRNLDLKQKEQSNIEYVRRLEIETLSKVLQLELQLGRAPTMADLLAYFTKSELDLVWDAVLMYYPDIYSSIPEEEGVVA